MLLITFIFKVLSQMIDKKIHILCFWQYLATALLLNIEYLDICSIEKSNIFIYIYIYQLYPYICVSML